MASGSQNMTSYKVKTIASQYTANGGQQPPNYFGTNTSGILMMNTTVNGNSQYKDWLIMDAYHGTDVGGGVAIGVNRQSLGAYIMRSAATRTAWAESAELLGTHNAYTYLDSRYVNVTGDTMTGSLNMSKNQQIIFYGDNNNTSPKAQIGYQTSVTGVMHCQNNGNHQTAGAFYIWSNGSNAANDNGGIAIDNEGVTVFGAGDIGSNLTGVFRVINEDDVASGPIFSVKKAGDCYFGKGQGYYISNDGSEYTGNSASATKLTSNAGSTEQPIYFTGGKPAATSYALKATVNAASVKNTFAYYSNTNAISSYSRIRNIGSARYPIDLYLYNDAGNIVGELWYDMGNATNVTAGSWRFLAYSPKSTADTGTTGKYEYYYLPTVTTGRSDNASYAIRTSKDNNYTVSNATTASKLADSAHSWTATEVYNYMTARVLKAGDSMSGTLSWGGNINSINFRTGHASYDCIATYRTAGNEAMCFTTKASVTSFIFYNGEDSITNSTSDRWYSIINGVQIKNNCLAIGAGWANGVNPDYKLKVGGNMYISGTLHSSYKSGSWVNSLTNSAIIIDDAANSYGGWICGPTKNGRIAISTYQYSDDILYIGYGERGRTTNSFARSMTWNGANGRLTTASVANAIWNDIAESRVSDIQTPGYVIAPDKNKIAHITTKRLQSAGRIISDTYGYLLGDEDDKHAPVAIAGRVLAYPLHDKSYYEPGDAVCATEGGKIDKMTREEIKEYPDRIVGIVNEIPDYDIWEPSREGKGGREPIYTNGRIWIDVR